MLSPHKYFPHITQIFSMLLDSHKYSLYKQHILPWALSQILPIISYMLSNLGFPQKYSSYYYQRWAKNYTMSIKKAQNHLPCGKNPKSPTKPSKNLLLHGTSKSLLLHGTCKAHYYTAPLKAHCYTVIFLQNLIKPKYYFGTYFAKPNIILAPILQSPILFWHLFYKAQILFWQKQLHYAQKLKTIS